MKIAFFSNSYLPYLSGVTLSIKTLSDELQELGHSVAIVGPQYPGHRETSPNIFRLLSIPAPYPGYRLVLPYSYNIFSKLNPEIIHAHQPFGVGLAALLLARRRKIPFVYSFHTLFSRYVHHVSFVPQRLAKLFIAVYLIFFCNQADCVIVPSEMVRRFLVLRKIKTRVEVIPTGVDLNKIKPKFGIRQKFGIPPEAKFLLYSGRLSAEKNVPFLLEAFPRIRQQEKDAYLLLAGGGPKEKEYRKLARELDDHILFTGQIPHAEVIDCYLAADLFVYASITETQGLVLTEAKACGLPVVALFGGGLSDVVKNGVDGYLVPRNQQKFVEHVLRLLKNESLRKEMSVRAREDAHNRFSSLAVAKQMETVYNSLINQKR